MYLKVRVTENEKTREREAEAKSLEFSPRLLCGWQAPKYLSHLLLFQAHKQEVGSEAAEPKFKLALQYEKLVLGT